MVRRIVFTGAWEAFIGAVTPRDLRAEMGANFPEYERALYRAYGAAAGVDLMEFRRGYLSEEAVNTIAREFLVLGDIVVMANPTPGSGWVYLDRSAGQGGAMPAREFADRVTAGNLALLHRL